LYWTIELGVLNNNLYFTDKHKCLIRPFIFADGGRNIAGELGVSFPFVPPSLDESSSPALLPRADLAREVKLEGESSFNSISYRSMHYSETEM